MVMTVPFGEGGWGSGDRERVRGIGEWVGWDQGLEDGGKGARGVGGGGVGVGVREGQA